MSGTPETVALWEALPTRMPGVVPPVAAVRAGIPADRAVLALEDMVRAGTAVRRVRRGHDVYYRGLPPRPAATLADAADQDALW